LIHNKEVKKYLIGTLTILFLISFLEPANAYNIVSRNKHTYFSSELTLNQPVNSGSNFQNGIIETTLKIVNPLQPQFNNNFAGDEFTDACKVSPAPQWDTFFYMSYYLEVSTDPTFEDSDRASMVQVELYLNEAGKIIWKPENPNPAIQIFDAQTKITQDLALNQVFSQIGGDLISSPIKLTFQGGNDYYAKETLLVGEMAECVNSRNGVFVELGKTIKTLKKIKVDSSPQTIVANVPSGEVQLSSRAERISFSSSSGLPVEATETTPRVCILSNKIVLLKGFGECVIQFSQSGGSGYAPTSLLARFKVVANPSKSITCVKGSLINKISGTKPKCPEGFQTKK